MTKPTKELVEAQRAILREIRDDLKARGVTETKWAQSAGVPQSTLNGYLSGLIKGMDPAKVYRLAKEGAVAVPAFDARVTEKLGDAALAFQGSLLPTTLVPPTPDGFLLRFASQHLTVTRQELLGTGSDTSPIRMVMLARSLEGLRENINAPSVDRALVQHPLASTPFTYIGLSFALDQQIASKSQGSFQLQVLENFAMKLAPATFGIVARGPLVEPTSQSVFHRECGAGNGSKAAAESLQERLRDRLVLYDSEVAEAFLKKLQRFFLEMGLPKVPYRMVKVHEMSHALRLMAEGALNDRCLIVAWHAQIWAIRQGFESNLQLLYTNESDVPPQMQDILPYRVVVVPKNSLDSGTMDMAARWFVQMASKLRSHWRSPFRECFSFLTEEMHKYGVPGIGYSRDTLESLIDKGLFLHVPTGRPRFVDLTADYVEQFRRRVEAERGGSQSADE